MKNKFYTFLAIGLTLLALGIWWWSIQPQTLHTPKPKGYFAIRLPEKKYSLLGDDARLPYTFALNTSARWEKINEEGWITIHYPSLRAEIQLTYKKVDGHLPGLLNDAHTLAYKHAVVAQGIREQLYSHPENRVFGVLYSLQGEAATPAQFYATDSSRHFIRGAVYVFAQPNADSLAPVNTFLQEELIHLMESLEWRGK